MFQFEGVVYILHRNIFAGILLRALLRHRVLAQDVLLVIKYRDVLQGKLFSIENIVHGTKDLHDTFQRHTDNAFHTYDKFGCIFRGNIQLKSQFPEVLIRIACLTGRTNNDFHIAGIYDTIVIEDFCYIVAYGLLNSPDFIPV